mmetsp:Transcript_1688/g.5130  ORF Transcript_1688/g.5130 Transcript_1688/m.5130 type:complete len:96 (-) Transcript_1688:462-749(-)
MANNSNFSHSSQYLLNLHNVHPTNVTNSTTMRNKRIWAMSNISTSSEGVPKIAVDICWGNPVLTDMKTSKAIQPNTVSSLNRVSITGFEKCELIA